jgi:hypothetical protein
MSTRSTDQELKNLAAAARLLRELAESQNMTATIEQAQEVADTLDAAREQLAEDGPDYIDAAQAFIIAGADILVSLACSIGRCVHARA